MQRYYHIHEALGTKTIELYSELVPGQLYDISGTHYRFNGVESNQYSFTHDESDIGPLVLDLADLEQLIAAGDVRVASSQSELSETVPNFPHLDKFTRNTFNSPTQAIWDLAGIESNSSTDLYTLDSMVQRYNLNEMPLPDETKYESLVNDAHWNVLKKYLKKISPDIELPEELG